MESRRINICVKEPEKENSLLIVNYTSQRESDMQIKGGACNGKDRG